MKIEDVFKNNEKWVAAKLAADENYFKDLKVSYKSYLEGKTFVNVEGDYNKLTLSSNLKDSADYEVFLSDSPKYLFYNQKL